IAEMLTDAKSRASEIVTQGEKFKTEAVEQARTDAQAEADRIIAAAKAEIEQEVNRAKEALRGQVAELAVAGAAKHLQRAGDADGKRFVRVLLEAGRLSLLPEIRDLFDTLKDDAEGVARAQIISAFPIDDAELAGLTTALERRFGRRIEATVDIDPELIGGAK